MEISGDWNAASGNAIALYRSNEQALYAEGDALRRARQLDEQPRPEGKASGTRSPPPRRRSGSRRTACAWPGRGPARGPSNSACCPRGRRPEGRQGDLLHRDRAGGWSCSRARAAGRCVASLVQPRAHV